MNKLFLALDFPTWAEAEQFLRKHELEKIPVKVGMELYYREGPMIIEKLKEMDCPIFLDLKLYDIPTTVYRAMKNIARLGVDFVNVHALGGGEMIARAKEGLSSGGMDTKLLAVTLLTSMDEERMTRELNMKGSLAENVVHLACLAQKNGADGVVCSVHEAEQIKKACGESFLTVTPGIRSEKSATHDQKRIATPAIAKEKGADILVVGRTITEADNPKQMYETMIKEWEL